MSSYPVSRDGLLQVADWEFDSAWASMGVHGWSGGEGFDPPVRGDLAKGRAAITGCVEGQPDECNWSARSVWPDRIQMGPFSTQIAIQAANRPGFGRLLSRKSLDSRGGALHWSTKGSGGVAGQAPFGKCRMKAIVVMFDTLNRHMLQPYGCD